MEFVVKNKNSIVDLSRKIGYVIIDTTERGEYNMVRKLHLDNYPRFHVYLKLQNDNYNFSLHLDQKKPVYKPQKSVPVADKQYDWRRGQDFTGEGGHAHNGEYFGPVVEEEADRIKEILE
jgi:hypothetical protein